MSEEQVMVLHCNKYQNAGLSKKLMFFNYFKVVGFFYLDHSKIFCSTDRGKNMCLNNIL